MIREDRELLAELARINTAMASLALRMMDNSASTAEQRDFAHRLIAAGERLRKRADESIGAVIEGEVLESRALSEQTSSIQTQSAAITQGQAAPRGR